MAESLPIRRHSTYCTIAPLLLYKEDNLSIKDNTCIPLGFHLMACADRHLRMPVSGIPKCVYIS